MKLRLATLIVAVATAASAARAATTLPTTGPVSTAGPVSDVVDLDAARQTIDHFGASDAWTIKEVGGWSDAARNRVADLLFSQTDGAALSCWRFNVGAGPNDKSIKDPFRVTETFELSEGRYDWSRQANQRWFLAAAKARGVPRFVLFSNSPPARMTRSGLTNGADAPGTSNLKPGLEPQYARFLADVLVHFRDDPDPAERVAFDRVSPVNEPQIDWRSGQEGSRWADEDIKGVVRALHAELVGCGLKTQILVPESNVIYNLYGPNKKMTGQYGAFYGDYIAQFCGDRSVNAFVGQVIAYHGYGSDGLDQLMAPRLKAREAIRAYPGWNLWHTEYCVMQRKRDLTMATALHVARVIHCDLTLADAAAWNWWLAVSPYDFKDGLIYTDYHKPGDAETVYPTKLLWALGNFSRFVRPGMRRVEIDGPPDQLQGLMRSAYRDASSGRVAVVYVNAGDADRRASIQFRLRGRAVPADTFTPYITSDAPGDDLRRLPPASPTTGIVIPARSVLTLTGTIR